MRVETDADARFVVHHGDNMAILPTLADCSVDAIVTDPPAGIAFMGKAWDSDKGGRDAWIAWLSEVMSECLRVLKPGGHALVWAIPRTSHWTGMAIENAGFEVRDRIAHCFGSGFPKSLDVSKAIDKAAGVERAKEKCGGLGSVNSFADDKWTQENSGFRIVDDPITAAARQWQGWGTALKPAIEDWWLARKPFVGTVAANVMAHGTGALNIDGCRIEGEKGWPASESQFNGWQKTGESVPTEPRGAGRWPANLILLIPEDEYVLRDDVTPEQLRQLADWIDANA